MAERLTQLIRQGRERVSVGSWRRNREPMQPDILANCLTVEDINAKHKQLARETGLEQTEHKDLFAKATTLLHPEMDHVELVMSVEAPQAPPIVVINENKKVASGGFADVYLGYDFTRNQVIIAKKFRNDQYKSPESVASSFEQEIKRQQPLIEAYVIGVHGGYSVTSESRDTDHYMIMERMKQTLADHIIGLKAGVNPARAIELIEDMSAGLNYLHSDRGITHGDVSIFNLMLNGSRKVVFGDFGVTEEGKNHEQVLANLAYVPASYFTPQKPSLVTSEYLFNRDKDKDIFATAIIAYQLLTGDIEIFPHQAILNQAKLDWPRHQSHQDYQNKTFEQYLAGRVLYHHHTRPVLSVDKLDLFEQTYGPVARQVLERATALEKNFRYQEVRNFTSDLINDLVI